MYSSIQQMSLLCIYFYLLIAYMWHEIKRNQQCFTSFVVRAMPWSIWRCQVRALGRNNRIRDGPAVDLLCCHGNLSFATLQVVAHINTQDRSLKKKKETWGFDIEIPVARIVVSNYHNNAGWCIWWKHWPLNKCHVEVDPSFFRRVSRVQLEILKATGDSLMSSAIIDSRHNFPWW